FLRLLAAAPSRPKFGNHNGGLLRQRQSPILCQSSADTLQFSLALTWALNHSPSRRCSLIFRIQSCCFADKLRARIITPQSAQIAERADGDPVIYCGEVKLNGRDRYAHAGDDFNLQPLAW